MRRFLILWLRKLGCSCDWDRVRFTMDEGCSDAVLETFARLYEKGYIYRGEKIKVDKSIENSLLYGLNFQEQWDYAISVDPEIIFVTG